VSQFRLKCKYTWKCHKETPCVSYLKQTKCHFFLLQNQRTRGLNRSCLGLGSSGRGRRWGKGEEGEYGADTMNTWENEKMRTVEIIPEMEGDKGE
jgi:hypothetical protein